MQRLTRRALKRERIRDKSKEDGTYRRPGRPSAYDPKYCDMIIARGKQGDSKAQMASAIGKDRETVDNWAKEYPEFSRSLKLALEASLVWWENKGREGLSSKINPTMFIFQMKNRFRDSYYDHQVVTGPGGSAVQQLVIDPSKLAKMDEHELARAERNLLRLQRGADSDKDGKAQAADEDAYASAVTARKGSVEGKRRS